MNTDPPELTRSGDDLRFIPPMTLRDWFAGQALASEYVGGYASHLNAALAAYELADAMLAARSANKEASP